MAAVQLGLAAVLLQGLAAAGGQGAAAAPAEAAVDAAAVTFAHRRQNLHAWKVADGDMGARGRCDRRDGAMKMEMQVTAHRAGRVAWRQRRHRTGAGCGDCPNRLRRAVLLPRQGGGRAPPAPCCP